MTIRSSAEESVYGVPCSCCMCLRSIDEYLFRYTRSVNDVLIHCADDIFLSRSKKIKNAITFYECQYQWWYYEYDPYMIE